MTPFVHFFFGDLNIFFFAHNLTVSEYILTLFFDFVWVVSEKQAALLYKAVGSSTACFLLFHKLYIQTRLFLLKRQVN